MKVPNVNFTLKRSEHDRREWWFIRLPLFLVSASFGIALTTGYLLMIVFTILPVLVILAASIDELGEGKKKKSVKVAEEEEEEVPDYT